MYYIFGTVWNYQKEKIYIFFGMVVIIIEPVYYALCIYLTILVLITVYNYVKL